jgi:hypothetical protein
MVPPKGISWQLVPLSCVFLFCTSSVAVSAVVLFLWQQPVPLLVILVRNAMWHSCGEQMCVCVTKSPPPHTHWA